MDFREHSSTLAGGWVKRVLVEFVVGVGDVTRHEAVFLAVCEDDEDEAVVRLASLCGCFDLAPHDVDGFEQLSSAAVGEGVAAEDVVLEFVAEEAEGTRSIANVATQVAREEREDDADAASSAHAVVVTQQSIFKITPHKILYRDCTLH